MGLLSARVFVPCKPLLPSEVLHSSLLGPFLSYEENEGLWIQSQGLYFIVFSTYDLAQ